MSLIALEFKLSILTEPLCAHTSLGRSTRLMCEQSHTSRTAGPFFLLLEAPAFFPEPPPHNHLLMAEWFRSTVLECWIRISCLRSVSQGELPGGLWLRMRSFRKLWLKLPRLLYRTHQEGMANDIHCLLNAIWGGGGGGGGALWC